MCTNPVDNLTSQVDFESAPGSVGAGDECFEPNFQMIPPFGDYDYSKEWVEDGKSLE